MNKQDESIRASDPTPTSNSRREFLKSAALGGLTLGAGVTGGHAAATTAETPPDGWPMSQKWFPSRWGATDQAGASNLMTPAKVLEAAALMKTGKVYSLGRVYEAGMPFFGTRGWNLKIPGPPFFGPVGRTRLLPMKNISARKSARSGRNSTALHTLVSRPKGRATIPASSTTTASTQRRCMDRSA